MATIAESAEQTLEGQSPREHRADTRLQCRMDATDLSTDQSLEVGTTDQVRVLGSLASQENRRRGKEPESTTRGHRLRWNATVAVCTVGIHRWISVHQNAGGVVDGGE